MTGGSESHGKNGFIPLMVGSIGVVYGDIGTSPLYALKESVKAAAGGGSISEPIVFGVVSLIFWALMVIVTIKYVAIMLNADNKGEGAHLVSWRLRRAHWDEGAWQSHFWGLRVRPSSTVTQLLRRRSRCFLPLKV